MRQSSWASIYLRILILSLTFSIVAEFHQAVGQLILPITIVNALAPTLRAILARWSLRRAPALFLFAPLTSRCQTRPLSSVPAHPIFALPICTSTPFLPFELHIRDIGSSVQTVLMRLLQKLEYLCSGGANGKQTINSLLYSSHSRSPPVASQRNSLHWRVIVMRLPMSNLPLALRIIGIYGHTRDAHRTACSCALPVGTLSRRTLWNLVGVKPLAMLGAVVVPLV